MSKLIVITGPSGVGKTTLAHYLLQELCLKRVITCTTREIRDGEVDGVDYNFFSRDFFKNLILKERFAEYANVYGNYYGVLKKDISNSLKSYNSLIILDVQGSKSIKKLFKNSIVIFLLPPSKESIFERIEKRNKDSEESLNKRIRLLEREISWASNADHQVVNENLRSCKIDLRKIVENFLNAS